MTTTGKTLPGTASEVSSGGATVSWATVDNIKAVGGGTATATFSEESQSNFLVATNFGFAIPAGNVINGGIVYILGDDDFIFDGDPNISSPATWLFNSGAPIGSAKGLFLNSVESSGGSATDKWSATLTPAVVNGATFGVGFQVQVGGLDSFGDARIDYVKMEVYHAPPSGGLMLMRVG